MNWIQIASITGGLCACLLSFLLGVHWEAGSGYRRAKRILRDLDAERAADLAEHQPPLPFGGR